MIEQTKQEVEQRYTAKNRPDKYDKMDCKGIETVRRDNSPLVANMINSSLQKLNPEGAVKHAKQFFADLLWNRIDISQLVITKELAKTDYAAKQAHVELAAKMKKRDAGSAQKTVFDRENCIPIDANLENQLFKPLLRIYESILGEKAESILLRGDHTRTRAFVTSKVGALAAYTKKRDACLGSKDLLPVGYEVQDVCQHCKQHEAALYQNERPSGRSTFYMRTKIRMELDTKWKPANA